jgi:hypothetical protein
VSEKPVLVCVGSYQTFVQFCRDEFGEHPDVVQKNRTAIFFRDWRDLRGLHRPGKLVVFHDADSKAITAAEREIGWMNAEWPENRRGDGLQNSD